MDGQYLFQSAEDPLSSNGDGLRHYSRGDVLDEATRRLAANTQVSPAFAGKIRHRIISEPFLALAPVYGADPVPIARWALSALRRRFRRDVVLTLIFIAAAAATLFFVPRGEWPREAWVLGITLVLVIGVVTREKFQIRKVLITRMRRGVFNKDDAPEPKNEETRKRLAEVEDRRNGNLVIFHGASPFAGSGNQADRWHLVIDVSHPAEPGNGTRPGNGEFSNAELHAGIVRALETLRKMAFQDMRVTERMFVSGRYLQDNPGLLPGWDPTASPPVNVADSVLRRAVLNPAPDGRVYVCAEMPFWQGQLVTTLFARAVHASGSIYIEWSFRVLGPLSRLFPDLDELYDEPIAVQLVKALGWGLLNAIPAFLKAPVVIAAHAWRRVTRKASHGVQSWKIDLGQVFDYGAEQNIREEACGFGALDYFMERDKDMAIMLAQEALLQAVRSFLKERNIDLDEFENEAKVVTFSTQRRHNAGNVGTGIVVGDRPEPAGGGNGKVPPLAAPEPKS